MQLPDYPRKLERVKHNIITKEEAEATLNEETERLYLDDEEYSEVGAHCRGLTELAHSGNGVSRIPIPRDLGKRSQVADAFKDAFQLIGGVPRLAHWADTQPTEFYKLFARMIPTEAHKSVNATGEFVVNHVIPRSSALDE